MLPWELEQKNLTYAISEGNLKLFCKKENIDIKSFPSASELKIALRKFDNEAKNRNGLIWFVRRDQKPKDLLRHLRNAFAHGHFQRRQKNKRNCVCLECIDNSSVKAKGFIPLENLKGLVNSANSCKV